ncbi:hypothetical protein Tsubulata_012261 [Turnera subulata]|uniref:DUF4283 domain-containing protein n=1 Tax=Turnera subulata TaxID=218843 RepID=A0A9Q0FV77_9ROSI|nr:hypothetical protein Tsubulata_012261 [Turnera subulata]
MLVDHPPGGGVLLSPSTSETLPLRPPEPSRSFRDTVAQGSAWNEPTIDADFSIETGEVMIRSSPQGPIVQYTDTFRAKLYKNWENTLIIKPWGRTTGYKALNSRLTRLWQLGNGFKLIDLEQNYYLVKFYSANDYMCVLTGGPWMIFGAYLFVERWRQISIPAPIGFLSSLHGSESQACLLSTTTSVS